MAAVEDSTWELGTVILDRYVVFDIRMGGFATVLGVSDMDTGEDLAIKLPKARPEEPFLTRERFEAEVSFWLQLPAHPNIVHARFVEVVDEQPALFMEYVEGSPYGDLREYIDSQDIDNETAFDIAHQIAVGMDFANRRGEVAHLDIKPQNVLIAEGGLVKVTDFGLAGRVKIANGTYPRQSAGTWRYAAPEIFLGEAGDSRSDIFSLGLIFFEMITGRLPYPFDLSDDPTTAFQQLKAFHLNVGMDEITKGLYYKDFDGYRSDPLGIHLSGYLLHSRERRYSSFREVVALQTQILKVKPRLYPLPKKRVEGLFERAVSMYKLGRHQEALACFNQLLVQEPTNALYWLEAAKPLVASGDTAAARQFEAKARELDPGLFNNAGYKVENPP